MFQQLPACVRQTRGERAALVGWKFLQRVHEVHVRRTALQYIDHMLAQRCIVARAQASSARSFSACALLALRNCLLFLQAYFSETITCCGIPGTGCSVEFANPALRNIFSYSEKVYASPASVFASIITLNAAAVGGVTRSSFGTKQRGNKLRGGHRQGCHPSCESHPEFIIRLGVVPAFGPNRAALAHCLGQRMEAGTRLVAAQKSGHRRHASRRFAV